MNMKNPDQQRRLGATDITVNAIGLGGMPLSIVGRPDETQAHKVIQAFVERGGNFIDTANVYCLDDTDIGHNEKLVHKVLQSLGMRDQVLVATKGGLTRPNGRWEVNGKPLFLRTSCEQSLKALQTDAIALYQLHAVDPMVPFVESLGELIRLQDEGKILHIGLSNVRQDQLKYALEHTAIAAVQNRCNVFYKEDRNNGLIDYCHKKKVSYIPYSPVGGQRGHTQIGDQPVLQKLSKKYGESAYSIALSWLLHLGEHIIPIPGASRTQSVAASGRALGIELEAEDIDEIRRIDSD